MLIPMPAGMQGATGRTQSELGELSSLDKGSSSRGTHGESFRCVVHRHRRPNAPTLGLLYAAQANGKLCCKQPINDGVRQQRGMYHILKQVQLVKGYSVSNARTTLETTHTHHHCL